MWQRWVCLVSQQGEAACRCAVGYAGDTCNTCYEGYFDPGNGTCLLAEACAASSCSGNGSCNDSSGFLECECTTATPATRVRNARQGTAETQTMTALPTTVAPPPIHVAATAPAVTPRASSFANCAVGYTGDTCSSCAAGFHEENGSCVLDQQCLATSCSSNGACNDSNGVVSCTCAPGYSGTYCDACDSGYHIDANNGSCVVDQDCDTENPCGANGSCNDAGGVITCACDDGYANTNCDTCAPGYHDDAGACLLDETCLSSSCTGNGACNDSNGVVSCTCAPGYSGTYCDACDTGYHIDANNGSCVVDQDCDTENPCGANGSCNDAGGVITCACDDGYAGANCDTCAPGYHDDAGACLLDETCLPSSCTGNGACNDSNGVVSCTCAPGYSGTYCDACDTGYHIDANNGSCVVDQDCDTENPCGANGSCDDAGGTITCACDDGYAGANCDTCAPGYHDDAGACLLDETCLSSSCTGNGACDDSNGVVSCTCDVGFAGDFCDSCESGAWACVSGLVDPFALTCEQGTVDQQQTSGVTNTSAQPGVRWQSFTTSTSGYLTAFELHRSPSRGPFSNAPIAIYDGDGLSGTLLHSGTTDIVGGRNIIAIDPPLALNALQQVTFSIVSPDTGLVQVSLDNPYAGGRFGLGGGPISSFDWRFATYMTQCP